MTKIRIFNHKVPKRFEEKLANFETCGAPSKTRGLSGKTSRVIFRNALFWETPGQGGEGKAALRKRVDTCVNTRSRITRTQQVLDFYVHPSPCSSICWFIRWYRWRKSRFFASPGEGNCLIAFTLIILNISGFCGWGEEVKAKNEKSRTRA